MFEENIVEYIEGRMEGNSEKDFERRLEAEPELRSVYLSELARYKALKAIHRAEEKKALKEMLGKKKGKTVSFANRTGLNPNGMLSIAAGVMILLFLGYLLYPKPVSPEQLAMNYLEVYPLENIRGEQQENENKVPSPQEKLHTASQLLKDGKASEAIPLLAPMQDHPIIGDAASWYLALAYMLNKQESPAKVLLQEIRDKPHYRQEQAAEILKKWDQ